MHICLVGIEFPPDTDFGGIATYQKRMADALVALGNKVTVICGTDKNVRDYYEDKIHIIRLYTSRTLETIESLENYRKIVKETIAEIDSKEKIDIIETPEFSGEIIEFLKDRNIPVVVKLHTSYKIWACLNDAKVTRLSKKIELYEKLTMEYADKLICCSQILKSLIPIYHKNIDINNIEIIPNPADVENFFPMKNNHVSNTILYCGSFEIRKGIFQLAKAIPIIYDSLNVKDLKFQIIGTYKNNLRERFLNNIPLKYHKYIEFLGHINNKELNQYFNQARIGVIPSLFDNLPYVAMEELLTELPIVASENTGIREMIKNEESGILYDPKDYQALAQGVIKLYKNKELAEKYGKQGRKEILLKYSPEIIAKQNLQIYNQVIQQFKNNLQRLHVCLTNFEYPSETSLGGIATYQKRMADALLKAGCKVTVICGSFKEYQNYYEDGIHIYRIPKNFPYKNLNDYHHYRKQLAEKIIEIDKFDKIDILESPEISAELIDFFEKKTIPVVTKLHTSYTMVKKLNNVSMFPKDVENRIFKDENYILKYSDKLICCSQILKSLIPMYHENIDINNIEIIPNPADVENFFPTKNNHVSNTILYCGNFTKRKGIFQLAKAIPIIYDSLNVKDLKFQIIGSYDGVEQDGCSLKERFLNNIPLKYHKYIEFLGYINNKELNQYFNQARIGVIPSLFDNLPYVAMEELLTELPIVASENTGIREMIKNEESGILYDPKDYQTLAQGVIKLYKNKELAEKYGKQGRKEILLKYSPEIIAKQNLQIYNQVIIEFNNKHIVKQVCKKYNLKILGSLKKEYVNIVRKCLYNNQKCILKIYHSSKKYNFNLIHKILENECNNFPKIIFYDRFKNYDVYLYSYIEGKHACIRSSEQIKKVFNILGDFNFLKFNNKLKENNIFIKYNKYKNYLVSNVTENLSEFSSIINKIMFFDNKYVSKISQNQYCFIHGDLSYRNILWRNTEPFLIDFDECCFGPKEYDYANFIIKNCFVNDNFNIKLAKKIIKIAKLYQIPDEKSLF